MSVFPVLLLSVILSENKSGADNRASGHTIIQDVYFFVAARTQFYCIGCLHVTGHSFITVVLICIILYWTSSVVLCSFCTNDVSGN